MQRIDVLGLGSLAWDDILLVDALPAPDQKVRAKKRIKRVGGLTGGALLAAVRSGGSAAFAGRIGTDPASREVADFLAHQGIDLSLCVADPSHAVVQSVILAATSTGTRNVVSFREGETGAHPTLPDLSHCNRFNVLLVDHHGIQGQLRMAHHFRQTGRPVVCDIERQDDDATLELLRTCSHVILPELFALSLTGANTADRALPDLRRTLPNASLCLITQGARGGVFSQQHEPAQTVNHYHPPEIITSCDTTGCGDVFHGAFCVALSRGMPLEKCIDLAASKAAESLLNNDALRF